MKTFYIFSTVKLYNFKIGLHFVKPFLYQTYNFSAFNDDITIFILLKNNKKYRP